MTKLIEEGLSTAQIGQKPGPLNQTISQVVNAKGRFLKCDSNEDKMIRKQIRLIADMQKVLVVCIEGQTCHKFFFF